MVKLAKTPAQRVAPVRKQPLTLDQQVEDLITQAEQAHDHFGHVHFEKKELFVWGYLLGAFEHTHDKQRYAAFAKVFALHYGITDEDFAVNFIGG